MTVNIYNIISIIAIFQSFFLSTFFMHHQKGSRLSNRILGTLLSIFAMYVAYDFTMSFGAGSYFLPYYRILFLLSQTAFLFGPLFYWYARSVLDSEFHLRRKDSLHTLPFFLAIAWFTFKIFFLGTPVRWRSPMRIVASAGVLLQMAAYIIACLVLLRPRIRSIISSLPEARLSWLRFLVLSYILIWLAQLHFLIFIDIWKLYGLCPYSDTLYFTLLFVFSNCVAFIALKKPEIFSFSRKYEKSELSEQQKECYRTKILAAMECDKKYLEPSLSLSSLSKQLHIPVSYVSQIVNESFHANFRDFVNRYRVEESKGHLKEILRSRKTILEIAFLVGFNSKSSFNSAFKEHTGTAPRDFIKQS